MRPLRIEATSARAILGAVVLALLLGAGQIPGARAEFGDVVINRNSDASGMRPVVFPHWFHRMRYSCKVCHGDLGIALEAGGSDIAMDKIMDGKFCGACHNGTIAWAADRCDLCHSGKPGTSTQVHLSTVPRAGRPGAKPKQQ